MGNDFVFTSHGSVVTVEAVSDAARELAEDNFPVEGWQGIPTNFTTDHRAAINLLNQLCNEGWLVESRGQW